MPAKFIHLRLHTEFSMRDGMLRIDKLVDRAKQYQMKALAISDHSNLCGMVKFYKKCMSVGIKPIIGADIILREGNEIFLATLFCQNQQGYKNLTRLLSQAYLKGQMQHGEPQVTWEWLAQYQEGLIALSGGYVGDIGVALLANKKSLAVERLQRWTSLFPNRFYLELTRTGRSQEEAYVHAAVELALEYAIPVVATNDVRFLEPDEFEAHETRVCIHDGYVLDDVNRPRLYSEQQYFKSSAEMEALFSDIPEALENTLEIVKRCSCPIQLGQVYLPQFPVPEGYTTETYLETLSTTGLDTYFLRRHFTPEQITLYQKRLRHELSVIHQMGFSGYFLIVADFIGWAKKNKIPVGPGRGSGAGSIVAFALNITTLDPIEHDLLFERFLNPERVSMPDFDIDFCMEQRDRVIDYVADRYGRDAVSQIITYGTMAARAVVRDVGRALGLSYGFCDKIAKLIPFEIGMTLEKAMFQEDQLDRLYREEDDVTTLIDLAKKLEGIVRNAGKHAGGVVIAPGKLTDFTPLYCEADGSNLVTQFDKNDVEEIGLVKFDFLGLRTLTIIDWALRTINKDIDLDAIPLNDAKTFQLLQNCETTAVFQLESRGMKDLIRRLRPDSFDDMTALVALFRPGPLQSGMVDDYIDRKHGRAKVYYAHPDLENILKSTNGVILYQEQVMQIAQVLAGYTLGGADLLRRAMGKKNSEEMAEQRAVFVAGASKRGIDSNVSEHIFDLMEKFSGYGFNKSHSAAYALIAYQTAWLKAHFPAEFMAAVLSSDMDNTDKVVDFSRECERMQLTVLPPTINAGHYMFTVNEKGNIVYGLGAIKGAGQAAVEHIVEERRAHGKFNHLYEFCQRVDLHKVNKRVLEPLVKSGAFDCFGKHRAELWATLARAVQAAEQKHAADHRGQEDLFGGVDFTKVAAGMDYVKAIPWTLKEKLHYEKESLGMYFSGHPFHIYQKELSAVISCAIVEIKRRQTKDTKIAGILVSKRSLFTKAGKRMGVFSLEDHTGATEVTVFSRLYEEVQELLVSDAVLLVSGKVEDDTFSGGVRIIAESIITLDTYRNARAKCLVLSVGAQNNVDCLLEKLSHLVSPYRGGSCPLEIRYKTDEAHAAIQLGDGWKVTLKNQLIVELEQLCGKDQVLIEY